MRFVGRVGTPPLFIGQGDGAWEFEQLISVYRNDTFPGQSVPPYATGAPWLDNSWPYGTGISGLTPAHYSAAVWVSSSVPSGATNYQGTEGITSDSPTHGIDGTIAFTCNDRLKMYQMYIPPSNGNDSAPGANDASDYAPLLLFQWHWYANDSRPNPSASYAAHPGYVSPDGSTLLPEFPHWNAKYVNGMALP